MKHFIYISKKVVEQSENYVRLKKVVNETKFQINSTTVSLIISVFLAILKNFCMFLFVCKFLLFRLFRKSMETINLSAVRILNIFMFDFFLNIFGYIWLKPNEMDILTRTLDFSKPEFFQIAYICHWNRRNAHNFIKLSLLRARMAIRNFDVVCLLETYCKATIGFIIF